MITLQQLLSSDTDLTAGVRGGKAADGAQDFLALLAGALSDVKGQGKEAGLTLNDLTLFDMHEAFAAQTLANLKLMASDRFAREVLGRSQATGEVDESKFNVLGGSIAYGHPFAATGARMITQTLHELRRRGGGFGLVTACAAGGLGAAMVLEAE